MKKLIKKFIEVMNTRNVGALDRTVRILIGLGLIGLGIYNFSNSALAIVLGLLGVNVALTGIRGVCSIYYIFNHSTCPSKKL